MKREKLINGPFARLLVALLALVVSGTTQAAGLLTPKGGTLPALEIRDHQVSVVIEDGYAITTVEQQFHNPHAQDLEAVYSFPVPEHGAVAEFTMWIDGKPVVGEVLEKREARQVYEEERAAGREAGITEKDGHKTFDISVTPVRANGDTRIRMVYLQPAHIDTGIGRYVYPLEEGGVDEDKLAFWTANEKVTGSFSFDLQLRSAYPVDAVRVPGRSAAQVVQQGSGVWGVNIASVSATAATATTTINGDDEQGGATTTPFNPQAGAVAYNLDKDLVVYWRQQVGLPGSVDLIAHKPDPSKRGTFMLVVTPGEDLKLITEGRDYIFVLDISGSMSGKYATLADGVSRSLKKMSGSDRFRIVLFNNGAKELTSGYITATPENVQRYSEKVARVTPSNGTNLFAGIGLGLQSLDADRSSAIVLVTDGVANVGETAQRKFLDLIRSKDIRLFTFIMGNSANRPLLDAVTKASNGFAISISNSDEIVGQLLTATSKLTHQALHGVELKIDGVKTADITPEQIGSLYRGEQLVLFGHYWGDGEAEVTLKAKISGQPKQYQTRFNFPASSTANPEIERLWAYATIERMVSDMEDFGEKADLKQAVADLAKEYGLVTDYTSMVVVREEVFTQRNITRTNQARRQVEQAAQQQRMAQAPAPRRVDNGQPMFNLPRPNFGGGGALGPWALLLLMPLALWVRGRHRRN